MKKLILICIILSTINFVYSDIISNAQNKLNQIQTKNNKLLNKIAEERILLNKKLNNYYSEIDNLKSKYEKIKENNIQKQNLIKELNQEKNESSFNVENFKNNIMIKLKELFTAIKISSYSLQDKKTLIQLKNIIKKNNLISNNIIQIIFADYLKLINNLSKITIYNGSFYDKTGKKQTADILRIADFISYAKKNDDYKILKYSITGNFYLESKNKLNSLQTENLKNYFAKKSKILPIDITKGKYFKIKKTEKNIIEHIKSGGFIVYPILLLAFFAIIILIERLFFLKKVHIKSDTLMPGLIKNLKKNDFEKAKNICKKNSGALSRVCYSALKYKNLEKDTLENILQESMLKEIPMLEKHLSLLNIFAAISPLLGLLGTVIGMINTFDVISVFGTGNIKIMSGGISEALITTELGLIVAIPILLFHSFLSEKINNIINEIEKNALMILNLLTINKDKI